MLFSVRGKNRNHECSLRVEADSPKEAEAIGFKRGLFVTEVALIGDIAATESSRLDQVAEVIHRAWKATPQTPMQCFGRAVSNGQAAALLLCGLLTWAVDLQKLVMH